jgi:multidrug efflux system outer membrane protein
VVWLAGKAAESRVVIIIKDAISTKVSRVDAMLIGSSIMSAFNFSRSLRSAFWRAMIVSGTLGLCACALSSAPQHEEVVKQALPQGTTIPTSWSSAAVTDPVANDWLRSFNDPRLDALVAEAIEHNLNLRLSAASVAIARQNVAVVGSQLLPQIGAKLGAATTRDLDQDEWFNSTLAVAGVYWEVDLWGRLRAQRVASEEIFKATALDYAFARQSLAATVAKSWYLTIETGRLQDLAEQAVRIYGRLLDLVKVRRTAGKVGDLDVAEAGANLSAAENTLRTVQGQYSEARRTLELLLGRYPAAELAVAKEFSPLPPVIRAGVPSALLDRRPDLVAAERQVLAAFRLREAAELALLPSFALTLEGGRVSDGLLSLLNLNPWALHGAAGMEVPLYTGGRLTAQVKIATAQQEQAVALYGSVALQAFYEVEVALTNETLLEERLRILEREIADRAESVRIARLKYTVGAMDMLSVLQLQEGLLQSRAKLIQLRYALLANRITLHLALGGGFDAAPASVIAN